MTREDTMGYTVARTGQQESAWYARCRAAREHKRQADALAQAAQMAHLSTDAPDLAARITAGELGLKDAIAALRRREKEHHIRVQQARQPLACAVAYAADNLSEPASRASILDLFDPDRTGTPSPVTADRLRRAARHLELLADAWPDGHMD